MDIEELKGKVIVLGNTRIRVSNIKEYGIYSKPRLYEKVYRKTTTSESKIYWLLKYRVKRREVTKWEWNGEYELITSLDRMDELGVRKGLVEPIIPPDKNTSRSVKVRYKDDSGKIQDGLHWENSQFLVEFRDSKYLYVETYQGDKYEFYQDGVDYDIEEKCHQLDEFFS